VSWGVLFYGFAVVAPEVTTTTGWSESVVSGAFSVGLVVAGVAAPAVATALARRDPRLVLGVGSLVGVLGMLGFAAARHVAVLYLAWVVIGLAMAATLYEPAMAVLVALDPDRRHRTLTTVTVAGGLASTVFAPLGGLLVDSLGWRSALVVLAIGGGAVTALLHALVLPSSPVELRPAVVPRGETVWTPPVRRLRVAMLFESAAVLATTAHLIGLLVGRDVTLAVAGAALGVMGIGKVAGRLLLLGPLGRGSLPVVAAACNVVQLVGLAVPLATTADAPLFAAAAVVGAASGATTVLRPLIVVDLVGPGRFAQVNARLQRATTFARAGAPFVVGAGAATIGWGPTWALTLVCFGLAAERYLRVAGSRSD
jgi:predicted MFS family arabinose efflux permease